MAWIKKTKDVEVAVELEYDNNSFEKTDAYELEITDVYLQNSKADGSKSVSLVVGVKDEDGHTNRTYFTVLGRDGETWYETTIKGKKGKRQHHGLSIANTLFGLALDMEIFDAEPVEVEYERWDKDAKEMVKDKADGFPDLVGKTVGGCVQMTREIDGADSKEYASVVHFFDAESGLFFGEDEGAKVRKLDKWLKGAKEFIITEKEDEAPRSSFGKKKEAPADGAETPKKRWGR